MKRNYYRKNKSDLTKINSGKKTKSFTPVDLPRNTTKIIHKQNSTARREMVRDFRKIANDDKQTTISRIAGIRASNLPKPLQIRDLFELLAIVGKQNEEFFSEVDPDGAFRFGEDTSDPQLIVEMAQTTDIYHETAEVLLKQISEIEFEINGNTDATDEIPLKDIGIEKEKLTDQGIITVSTPDAPSKISEGIAIENVVEENIAMETILKIIEPDYDSQFDVYDFDKFSEEDVTGELRDKITKSSQAREKFRELEIKETNGILLILIERQQPSLIDLRKDINETIHTPVLQRFKQTIEDQNDLISEFTTQFYTKLDDELANINTEAIQLYLNSKDHKFHLIPKKADVESELSSYEPSLNYVESYNELSQNLFGQYEINLLPQLLTSEFENAKKILFSEYEDFIGDKDFDPLNYTLKMVMSQDQYGYRTPEINWYHNEYGFIDKETLDRNIASHIRNKKFHAGGGQAEDLISEEELKDITHIPRRRKPTRLSDIVVSPIFSQELKRRKPLQETTGEFSLRELDTKRKVVPKDVVSILNQNIEQLEKQKSVVEQEFQEIEEKQKDFEELSSAVEKFETEIDEAIEEVEKKPVKKRKVEPITFKRKKRVKPKVKKRREVKER